MKKVIIAGSTGLIGKSVAKFMKKNYVVIELNRKSGDDFTNEKFVKQWFRKNKADYLINLFALNDHVYDKRKKQTLFDVSLDSFNSYLKVNLTALFSVCREFARNNKKGTIINFSSIYGILSPIPSMYKGKEKHIGYSVSKAGVIMLTKHLAAHLAPNIKVNCVVPGGIKESNIDKKFEEEYSKRTPLKRMMNVNEINGIIEYLCSEKASYVTGSIFCLDGGWTIQ